MKIINFVSVVFTIVSFLYLISTVVYALFVIPEFRQTIGLLVMSIVLAGLVFNGITQLFTMYIDWYIKKNDRK
jgi:hypothetical protein